MPNDAAPAPGRDHDHDHDHDPDWARYGRGLPDHHNPAGGIGGAAPALSALTLRLVLAAVGFVLGVAGAIFLAAMAAPGWSVVLLAVIAASALLDIGVILRRKRRGEPG